MGFISDQDHVGFISDQDHVGFISDQNHVATWEEGQRQTAGYPETDNWGRDGGRRIKDLE